MFRPRRRRPRGTGSSSSSRPGPSPRSRRPGARPLDRHRLVFVSARSSRNDAHVLYRRLPLALLAYESVRARFPIDDERVYVIVFSGDSRVAEVAALAHPDVFRGAILHSAPTPSTDRKASTSHPPTSELVFGLGSVVGMASLSSLIGCPLARAVGQAARASHLSGATRVLSAVVGVLWGSRSSWRRTGRWSLASG
ncbi:MAG TPA: hypothetical protein VK698_28420 [Kofleriaceae bacterium]|nr:hypothetical protein [Kofleriaceae bacterium]